ncbi:putative protein arginine N-methyltransferase 9 [Stylophora pistillata]|uniref:Uncharacterized protein n=1 Tax=Stylophora pistillata TaxID=50429 RepID=A0A2B4SDH1_STYPI|nr:putative protein arginine N-methyltransferase 9 [Stylophora pistillata]
MQENSSYSQHFHAAKSCLYREKYGDALAHLVFLANMEPSSKEALEIDFILALRKWLEILESRGELDKMIICLREALKLYPQSEIVLINTGANLVKLGFTDEAASCFRRALHLNPTSIRAKENLENVANLLVERWHFRMLNDKKRNVAYKQAIAKAIGQGHDVVLDIGSGTGILSMFAVQSGAKEVYACEMSKTMFEMGQDVLRANKMEKFVHTVHKKSTEMTVGKDIPKQVSLVVTETLDCGLLGEGILTTIEHAWCNLLILPPEEKSESDVKPISKVIPGGAVLYAMVIMCDDIRNQTRCKPTMRELKMLPECSIGGELISLNKDRDLKIEITATHHGQADAVAVWFDLLLDEDITLSTGPKDDSLCWEQAIFPIFASYGDSSGKLAVSKGDLLSLQGELSKDCLRFNFCGSNTTEPVFESKVSGVPSERERQTSISMNPLIERKNVIEEIVAVIPPSYMRRLNDASLNSLYDEVISGAVNSLKLKQHLGSGNENPSKDGVCNVLDITNGPALFSHFAARGKADHVLILNPHNTDWIEHILRTNHLPDVIEKGPKKLEEIAREGRKWNLLVSDTVEPSGVLCQQVMEDIVFSRGCLLTPRNFQTLPMGFTLYCMCIESPFLFANCCVLDQDRTLGLEIGHFVNDFQVTTQIDIDLTTLPFSSITNHTELFSVNFMEQFDDENKLLSLLETHSEKRVKVSKSGRIQAIPYWFALHIGHQLSLSTYSGDYPESHWRQAAIVLK